MYLFPQTDINSTFGTRTGKCVCGANACSCFGETHITVTLLHSQAASIFLVGSRITVAVLQPIKIFCMKWPLKASFPGFYYLQYSVCKYGCLTKNHEAFSCNVYPRTRVWYIQKAQSVRCWLHLGLINTNSSCLTAV